MPRKVFVSCSGLGMGNASRVFAIGQAIARLQPGTEVHFFSWGKGFEFLQAAIAQCGHPFQLHALSAYVWISPSALPGWRALRMLSAYSVAFVKNNALLRQSRLALKPDLVIFDSDYHFLAFLPRRCPLFFLGQAFDVVARAKLIGYKPSWLSRLSFFACEVLDGFLQRLLADKVFVPSFLEQEESSSRTRTLRVPLIVREEFLSAGESPPLLEALGVGSGSGIESKRLGAVVSALGGSLFTSEGVRLTQPRDFQSAKLVVIQGGLTSISECIALGKKMLVVPIHGRAEQEINAKTVEQLGFGLSSERERAKILVHGAEVVARHAFEFA